MSSRSLNKAELWCSAICPPFADAVIALTGIANANVDKKSRTLSSSVYGISVGGFDEDPALLGSEDYNLWLRISAAGWKIYGIPEELFVYAPPGNSFSSQFLRSCRAEISSAKKIAIALGLSPDEVLRKELAVFDQFGRDLVSVRQLKQARNFFGEALVRKLNVRSAFWWLVTWLPVPILDWRRMLYGHHAPMKDTNTT